MSDKDRENADLPESDNPSQNSQLANAIGNQSSARPGQYPAEKRKTAAKIVGGKPAERESPGS